MMEYIIYMCENKKKKKKRSLVHQTAATVATGAAGGTTWHMASCTYAHINVIYK